MRFSLEIFFSRRFLHHAIAECQVDAKWRNVYSYIRCESTTKFARSSDETYSNLNRSLQFASAPERLSASRRSKASPAFELWVNGVSCCVRSKPLRNRRRSPQGTSKRKWFCSETLQSMSFKIPTLLVSARWSASRSLRNQHCLADRG